MPKSKAKGTIIEVNVSELGLVTTSGKVAWGKMAQVTNNPELDVSFLRYDCLKLFFWCFSLQCKPHFWSATHCVVGMCQRSAAGVRQTQEYRRCTEREALHRKGRCRWLSIKLESQHCGPNKNGIRHFRVSFQASTIYD